MGVLRSRDSSSSALRTHIARLRGPAPTLPFQFFSKKPARVRRRPRPRPGGTAGVCHWLGQCFGGDLCEVTRFVNTPFEKQRRKGNASLSMCPASLLPARGRNVNRPIAVAKPVARATATPRSPLPPCRSTPGWSRSGLRKTRGVGEGRVIRFSLHRNPPAGPVPVDVVIGRYRPRRSLPPPSSLPALCRWTR